MWSNFGFTYWGKDQQYLQWRREYSLLILKISEISLFITNFFSYEWFPLKTMSYSESGSDFEGLLPEKYLKTLFLMVNSELDIEFKSDKT